MFSMSENGEPLRLTTVEREFSVEEDRLLVSPLLTDDFSCFCCSSMSAVVRSLAFTMFGDTLLSHGLFELDFFAIVLAPSAAVMAATAATVEVALHPHSRSDGEWQMAQAPSSSLLDVVAFISISFIASARLPTVRAALGLFSIEAAAAAAELAPPADNAPPAPAPPPLLLLLPLPLPSFDRDGASPSPMLRSWYTSEMVGVISRDMWRRIESWIVFWLDFAPG
uniref:Uncharacterized protein n=1 Tax=Anopheles coluzzii TaxID=1518534 RepID=A0A8W7PS42_ANOCL